MTARPFEPPSRDLGQRFLTGTMFTVLSQALRMVVQIVSVAVLGRLLLPTDFGVVAMAAPVVAFITTFSDLGVNQAAVQRRTLDHGQANALFWLTFGLSAVLAALILLLSPAVGLFYHDSRAAYICAAFAPVLLIGGLAPQHQTLLARTMRFGRLAVIEVSGAVVNLVATIVAALVGLGYWSLMVGTLVSTVTSVAASWLLMPWRPTAPASDPELRAMLRFGAGLTGFNLANFFSRNLDNVMIGRLWGAGQLGLYDRAYKLLLFPLSQVTGPVARVIVPTLSRLLPEPAKYRRAFLDVLSQMLLVTTPGVVVLIATAPVFVPLLMGDSWAGIVPLFLVLGYTGLVQPLNNPTGWLFVTQARTGEYARWGLFAAVVNVIAFVIGIPYGAYGVALAYTVSEYLRTPILWWLVTRTGPVRPRDIAGVVLPQALTVAVVLPLLQLWVVPRIASGWLALMASLVVAYAAALAIALLFPASRASVRRCVELLARLLLSARRQPSAAGA